MLEMETPLVTDVLVETSVELEEGLAKFGLQLWSISGTS